MKTAISLVVIFCLLSAFTGASYAAVDSIYEAAVIEIAGDVKADLLGDGNWVMCFKDLKLMKGAKLKTGSASSVEIAFDKQGLNVLKIKENTTLTIDDSLVKLAQGSVLALFKNIKPGSSFVVKTPNAACGIRGSGMGVDFINNMTVVAAFDDKVFVQGLDAAGNPVDAEVVIPEGWKSQVAAGNVTPPAELSANELAVWDAFVEAVQSGAGSSEAAGEDELTEGEKTETDTKDLEDQKTKPEEKKVISPSGSEDNSDSGGSFSNGYDV
ncbi:MAG: FecR domain-containing protein [Candidatus Omnitrophica bacterium]|nr:FecR domain-containing protein [Candidatus Omnitrophota bacterium]